MAGAQSHPTDDVPASFGQHLDARARLVPWHAAQRVHRWALPHVPSALLECGCALPRRAALRALAYGQLAAGAGWPTCEAQRQPASAQRSACLP